MVSVDTIKQLRKMSGISMMECKKALEESAGNIEGAMEFLRKSGKLSAAKRTGRTTAEGVVGSYVHSTGKIGVLVDLRTETDFVARSPEFRALAHDLAMHVAAADPRHISFDRIPKEVLDYERSVAAESASVSGKPADVAEKIIEGKLKAWAKEFCLLDQPFVKDPDRTVREVIEAAIARFGENVSVERFMRYQI